MAASSIYAAFKTRERLIGGLLVDDDALIAFTELTLQHITYCSADACRLFGLGVSLRKIEVLHQPFPGTTNLPMSTFTMSI